MKLFRGTQGLTVLAGVAMLLLGLMCVLRPYALTALFPPVAGSCFLALGIVEMLMAWTLKRSERDPAHFAWQGVLNTVVGAALLLNRRVSLVFAVMLVALCLAAAGAIRLYRAFRLWAAHSRWLPTLGDAVVKLLFAFLLAFHPAKGISAGLFLLGIALMFAGASVVVSAVFVSKTFQNPDSFFDDGDGNDS